MWQGRVVKLDAHGHTFKLGPVLKISSLRMLATGSATEHFDIWKADPDATGAWS